MNYKLFAATLAFLLPIACGGGGSSSTTPGDSVAAPASGGTPVAPGPDVAPTPASGAPAGAPPAGPTAGAPSSGGPAAPGSTPDEASCSESFNFANGRSDYDERCTEGGRTTSRECTLESGESAWSCMCTAASGSRSTCQSAVPRPGVITAPDDCCPAP
ncbi:MAG TPA: hypothetical protein VFK85_12920 [Anaeromyxobacteraceae bacterium]|nr:hypothetical protein [Anaeromyxobacteraceae bacterium]